MSETAMWLFPLPIATALILFFSFRAGWRWTWGVCLQQLLILLVTIAAFYFLYAPVAGAQPALSRHAANYLTVVAWALFFAFNFGQRMAVNALTLDLSLLRVSDARSRLPLIYALCWGPPAAYWRDIVTALAAYQEGNNAAADAVFDRWRTDPRIPPQSRDGLMAYALIGRVMRHDWSGIIQSFLDCRRGEPSGVPFVPLELAARAFVEEHKYDESFRCLRAVLEQSARITPAGIDMNFLPFFALSGAVDQLKTILARCTNKKTLPEYARLLWLGRCYGINGDSQAAMRLFEEAREKTPPELTIWHERIRNSIAAVENKSSEENNVEPASADLIAEAWHTYSLWRLAADMMRPAKLGAGLCVMMVALTVAYLMTDFYSVFHNVIPLNGSFFGPGFTFKDLQNLFYGGGELNKLFWQGQWWRSITYMFLHGNTAHLVLNIGALFLFGKPVERMYGTWKFFFIFFLSGILSGLLQLCMTPNDPAVGASGAIFGVFGAAIAGIIKLKKLLPAHLRKFELRWMITIAAVQVGFDQTINKVAEATDKSANGIRIAAFAHLGGMISGFAIGMLLPLRKWDIAQTVDIDGRSG